MSLFIKNPETERKARELARLTGETLTGAIDAALTRRLEEERAKPRRRRTLEEMQAATDEFRRVSGADKVPYRPVTKEEWDALWPTGVDEFDNA